MTLQSKWSVTVGNPDRLVYLEPVDSLLHGTGDNGVSVRSPVDGSERYSVETSGRFSGAQYIEDADVVLVLTRDDHAHAVDPETGTERWDVPADDFVGSVGGVVVLHRDRTARGYRASDGEPVWSHTLPGEMALLRGTDQQVTSESVLVKSKNDSQEAISSIAPEDGTERWTYDGAKEFKFDDGELYGILPQGDELSGLCGKRLVRLDRHSGDEVWAVETPELAGSRVAIGARNVYFRDTDGTLVCLDADTGGTEWMAGITEEFDCEEIWPVGDGSRVLVQVKLGYENRLQSYDPGTGTVEWEYQLEEDLRRLQYRSEGDAIYAGTREFDYDRIPLSDRGPSGEKGGTVVRLDESTGERVWRFTPAESIHWIDPVYDFPGEEYTQVWTSEALYAVDDRTGTEAWSFSVDPGARLLTYTTGGHTIVTDESEHHVLRLADGQRQLHLDRGPFIVLEGAFFTAQNGTLTAYELADGAPSFQRGSGGTTDRNV